MALPNTKAPNKIQRAPSIPALNTYNFPIKPAVSGIPAKESKAKALQCVSFPSVLPCQFGKKQFGGRRFNKKHLD